MTPWKNNTFWICVIQHGEINLATEGSEECVVLEPLIHRLKQIKDDPKLSAILYYLEEEKWQAHGVIIFSQYYDTAKWCAHELAVRYPEEAIGLYAGAGRSKLYQQGECVGIERETGIFLLLFTISCILRISL